MPLASTFRRALLPLGAALMLVPAAGAHAADRAVSADIQSIENSAVNALTTEVNAYATSQGPYANGVWSTSDNTCWACDQGGPATAAATLYVLSGGKDTTDLARAEATIDNAIATQQAPNGGFVDPDADGQYEEIATEFFGVEFATVDRLLGPSLSPAEQAKWQASLEAAADYLINNGNETWYSNGNINLGNAEFFELVALDTGNPKYTQAFDTAFSFLENPPQAQWPGDGLQITQAPTAADGSDGAGFLAEIGAGGTGYDAEYTSLQTEIASRLYLLTGDPQVLRLLNLLTNQTLERTNESTWMLDTSNGTRHTDPVRSVVLLTPALAVLGIEGNRGDLAAVAPAQVQNEAQSFTQSPWQDNNPVYRRSLGNDLSVIALAAAPTSVTSGLLGAAPTATQSTTTAPAQSTTAGTPANATSSGVAATASGPAATSTPTTAAAAMHKAKRHTKAKRHAKARGQATAAHARHRRAELARQRRLRCARVRSGCKR